MANTEANEVTELPPARLPDLEGTHDLCFTFTQRGVDPMYAIDWIDLEPREQRQ